jgi:hypothetical protein
LKQADIDPIVRAGTLYDVDEVFTAREAVGDEFWTESRMYREWNKPYGLTEHMSGIIRKDVVRVGALTVLRQILQTRGARDSLILSRRLSQNL